MKRLRVAAAAVVVPATAAVLVSGVAQAAEPVTVQSVVASGDDGNVAANTLDGDLATRWSDEAGWSATSGTHTMVVREAITALPADKPHVVAGQIHDGDDDVTVFRLEGTKLYVTKGDTTHHKLVDDDYVLGTPFEAKFVVSGGSIRAYYNGVLQTTISASFPDGYFKAGSYTQANCGNSDPCSDGNYGEVVIHDITVTHS